jgi:outer membrane protein OmpA-like peptidoglycan-associated protein
VDESRITSTGYGETKPVADNKTAAGRQKNRRVEMQPSYY